MLLLHMVIHFFFVTEKNSHLMLKSKKGIKVTRCPLSDHGTLLLS